MSLIIKASKPFFATEARACLSAFFGSLILGTILGLIIKGDSTLPDYWRPWSSIIGWTYFSAWTVSFWPQIIINWNKKSVVGLSFDYVSLNLLGFVAYSVYNVPLFFSESMRRLYAEVHDGSTPGVQVNDVFFGLHAVFATLIVICQICSYERGGQKVSKTAILILIGLTTSIAVYMVVTLMKKQTWLDFINYLSYVKLAISLMKYIPQTILNFKRKSTTGWSIHNVILDFTGGLLSVVQLIGDATSKNDWSMVTGDPVKFGLGFTSMFFDIIFLNQHYICYKQSKASKYLQNEEENSDIFASYGNEWEAKESAEKPLLE